MILTEHDRCPLCTGTFRILFTLPHATIVRCNTGTCGLAFTLKQPSDDELNDSYNSLYYLAGDSRTERALKGNSDEHKFAQHFDFLNRKLGLDGRRVLDYGCGVGNFLDVARGAGVKELSGVEFNDRARAVVLEKGLRVEKTIDPYSDASFDLVYMNDVIEHLRDPVSTLRHIGQKLSPGGNLFVVTMNLRGLKARLLRARWDLITDPTHLYFYDRVSLRRTFQNAGYRQVDESKFVVDFTHHGAIRSFSQRALVHSGLDTALKMLASDFCAGTLAEKPDRSTVSA